MTQLEQEIKNEIREVRKENPALQDDAAFVVWFLRAEIIEPNLYSQAKNYLTGISGDKSIDAIYIDNEGKRVYFVQGKFHQRIGAGNEERDPLVAFAGLSDIADRTDKELAEFYNKLDPSVKSQVDTALEFIKNRGYKLILYYVTTHKCSESKVRDAKDEARRKNPQTEIFIYDSATVLKKFEDYLMGVAPGVPVIRLRIAGENTVQTEGTMYRYDTDRKIESWIFSANTKDIGEIFNKIGIRLFSRNIRGYLGSGSEASVNYSIANTVINEPENFWYYNNGITIICYDAKQEKESGESYLYIEQPQIINGQQTTITLGNKASEEASVLVKLIKVPKNPENIDDYNDLINNIVKATNWQNYIKPADLVSNDLIQVYLERACKKIGYLYLRKRRTKAEIKALFGPGLFEIKKEDMAKAIAVCLYDPSVVRKTDDLFEKPYYGKIFSSRDPMHYLIRYWLMRHVKASAPTPESTRANWLVLYFAWHNIKNMLETIGAQTAFEQASLYKNKAIITPLHKALESVFKSALLYYSIEKGEGKEEKDIKSFFGQKILHVSFEKFWRSSKNKARDIAEKYFEVFADALSEDIKKRR